MRKKENEVKVGFHCKYIPLKTNVNIDFYAFNSHVYSIDKKSFDKETTSSYKSEFEEDEFDKFLVIEFESELEKIDSVLDVSRHVRPKFLILLGVISFFTKECLTGYQVSKSSHSVKEDLTLNDEIKIINFEIEGTDYRKDLRKVLEALSEEKNKRFGAFLLDRWRKGLFILDEYEGRGDDLFAEEAFLAFFHILELLSNHFEKERKKEMEDLLRNFLKKICDDVFNLRGRELQQRTNQLYGTFKNFLFEDSLAVRYKINYALSELNMLDSKTDSLVKRVVKTRNSIAHGKLAYLNKLIYPFPPFFPCDLSPERNTSDIMLLTRRAISKYFNLSVWEEELDEWHKCLRPNLDTVRKFLSKKEYLKIPIEDFNDGRYKDIYPFSIIEYYLEGKLNYGDVEDSLGYLILNIELPEDRIEEILFFAGILADSKKKDISSKSRSIVELFYKADGSLTILKDLVRYVEYFGKNTFWLKEWIGNEQYKELLE